jgi:predicted HAD superfamily Cof-like phosphohydrolase
MTNFEKVGEFLTAFGHPCRDTPDLEPDSGMVAMKVGLIAEELDELREGIDNKDLVEIADALADLLYVVYGVGHLYGVNLDRCLDIVHTSNMTKLGEDGKPIYRDDGKIMKGPNYVPPNLEEEVKLNKPKYEGRRINS